MLWLLSLREEAKGKLSLSTATHKPRRNLEVRGREILQSQVKCKSCPRQRSFAPAADAASATSSSGTTVSHHLPVRYNQEDTPAF